MAPPGRYLSILCRNSARSGLHFYTMTLIPVGMGWKEMSNGRLVQFHISSFRNYDPFY
jgi:hypothetical protein